MSSFAPASNVTGIEEGPDSSSRKIEPISLGPRSGSAYGNAVCNAAATPKVASNGRTYSTGNRCFVLSSNVTTARATEEKVSGPESAATET